MRTENDRMLQSTDVKSQSRPAQYDRPELRQKEDSKLTIQQNIADNEAEDACKIQSNSIFGNEHIPRKTFNVRVRTAMRTIGSVCEKNFTASDSNGSDFVSCATNNVTKRKEKECKK